jgi:phosphocarrier protein HPr
MLERRVTVGSAVGLHARPATTLCAVANSQPVKVTIGREDGPAVDARSIVLVMSLRIKGGETVILRTEDDGASAALDELAALVASELDPVA